MKDGQTQRSGRMSESIQGLSTFNHALHLHRNHVDGRMPLALVRVSL